MYKITSTMTNLNYCRINVRGYFSVLDNSYFTKTSNAQCPLSQNESRETYALYRDLGSIGIDLLYKMVNCAFPTCTTSHTKKLNGISLFVCLNFQLENASFMSWRKKLLMFSASIKK